MVSQALDRFTSVHGVILNDAIEITNTTPSQPKAILMQRLLVVSLAAFWEAFHEALCRETLARHPNPPNDAERFIDNFHNPTPRKIIKLYFNVLGITDITESWWGNPLHKTGKSPEAFSAMIEHLMNIRHDTAHGNWARPLSPGDCQEFLATTFHLAVRTDERVCELFPKLTK